ncbi:Na+/H+-dicarboxylate symporter [Sedimentibacter acidaminivorans]|jgi:Na+/H+-dicarboxylate symporter|uniref:Na+/H+-dicarboxylate symporter n=1 Tax=Sedimentibacter acidaminivorans TaxID=913099 RepID=A0ABS4GBZ2_9FIRM|nr:Na+/H+-dicarboxylate symporter [Sedimentibacter acidaminivorans]
MKFLKDIYIRFLSNFNYPYISKELLKDLPVRLVGLLIAIEPLIDMARTLVNVSDSMITGLISSKLMGELNLDVYNSKIKIEG